MNGPNRLSGRFSPGSSGGRVLRGVSIGKGAVSKKRGTCRPGLEGPEASAHFRAQARRPGDVRTQLVAGSLSVARWPVCPGPYSNQRACRGHCQCRRCVATAWNSLRPAGQNHAPVGTFERPKHPALATRLLHLSLQEEEHPSRRCGTRVLAAANWSRT